MTSLQAGMKRKIKSSRTQSFPPAPSLPEHVTPAQGKRSIWPCCSARPQGKTSRAGEARVRPRKSLRVLWVTVVHSSGCLLPQGCPEEWAFRPRVGGQSDWAWRRVSTGLPLWAPYRTSSAVFMTLNFSPKSWIWMLPPAIQGVPPWYQRGFPGVTCIEKPLASLRSVRKVLWILCVSVFLSLFGLSLSCFSSFSVLSVLLMSVSHELSLSCCFIPSLLLTFPWISFPP